ncbi:MAG: hypothetical protein NVV59_11620 [Chitinophagaceae bacterium]|nr:hypothetical protein [Chitinophagaceae bacterium]
MNLGRSLDRNIVVELKRTYPNNVTEIIQRDTLNFRTYRDSIVYTLPVVATRDQGLNKITVSVDADNDVDELFETNNVITKDIYIIEDDIRPVQPYPYSIVNKQDVKLIASTANPFADARTYLMEMDTTASFNSPLKVQRSQSAKGGIVEFQPGLSLTDSTVYYWRVAPVSTVGEPLWNQTSFQFIQNGSEGFSQAHYNQHLNSEAHHVRLTEEREWRFDSVVNNLFVKNGVWGYAISQAGELVVNVNDSSYIRNTCSYGFVFNVFDEKTFQPWVNQAVGSTGLFGSLIPCAHTSAVWNFEYPNTIDGRNKAMQFLRAIPDGKFVVLRTQVHAQVANNEYAPQWKLDENVYGVGNSLYTELKNNGLIDIDSIDKPRVMNFVYQKNRANEHPPKFVISDGLYDAINLSFDCVTPSAIGTIESPIIGPASSWSQLHWRGSDMKNPATDEPNLNVIGVRADGTEEELITGITLQDQDFDISSIDANEFPHLRLKMFNVDSIDYSAYQLRYWMVTYNPVPEGAIAPNIYFTTRDTVEVGEPFNFGIGFKNISEHKFVDSIKVQMTITGSDNVVQEITIPLQKDLAPNDTIKLDVPVDTRNLTGRNTIFVNFNPNMHQKEGAPL